jgi:hypothetical protein
MKLKVLLSLVALVMLATVLLVVQRPAVADQPEVIICHVEDKTTLEGHVISVSASSLGGHCNHGDEINVLVELGSECTASPNCF